MKRPFTISIKWSTDDVQALRPDLSYSQAKKVLLRVHDLHEPSVGVCRQVIAARAEELFPRHYKPNVCGSPTFRQALAAVAAMDVAGEA